MDLFEKNLEVLKSRYPKIGAKLENYSSSDIQDVYVGDAKNGDAFLALERDGVFYSLGSSYNPQNAAERYAEQYRNLAQSTSLLLYGLGDGKVVRLLSGEDFPVKKIWVYEPSLEVLLRSIQVFDFTDILNSANIEIFVEGDGKEEIEESVQQYLGVYNWSSFSFAALPVYVSLFPEKFRICNQVHSELVLEQSTYMNTAIIYAQNIFSNALRNAFYIFDCRRDIDLKDKFPKELPCIIVSAGPSLEKNVDDLKKAKGRACIICVDTALPYLLNHGVIPDYVSTLDMIKPKSCFDHPLAKGIPVFTTEFANHELLGSVSNLEPIFFGTNLEYYRRKLLESLEEAFLEDGGGSVATNTFRLALDLGFKTIILVGQDLSYQGRHCHAGVKETDENGNVQDLSDNKTAYEVNGYNGTPVYTSSDFKVYLDWFGRLIPKLSEAYSIINATEGGARISGTKQMTLEESIRTYCITDFDCKKMLNAVPRVYEGQKEKESLYHSFLQDITILREKRSACETCLKQILGSLKMIESGNYSEGLFKKNERIINQNLNTIQDSYIYDFLITRIAEQNYYMANSVEFEEDNFNDERKKLYLQLKEHMSELISAIDEAIPILENILNRAQKEYKLLIE